ncbi:MAG: BatA domain-containing protein [Bacteroidales bacterium]|nr:BatA domain-containing protein [Bacteroidales bacterium]
MTFLNPAFLYAFLVLLIPIAIHLFNFQKYKPLLFSNLQFLLTIQSKTKQQSQLKRVLLLISRLLIFSCLVIAFAQPVLKKGDQNNITSENLIVVFIDNSLSMGAFSSEGIVMMDLAKEKATETIEQFAHHDKFMILTNELEGGSFRIINKDDALNSIENIQLSHYSRNLNLIFKRINDVFENHKEELKIISIISDFQLPNAIFDKSVINPEARIVLNVLEHQSKNNIFIDSCWFEMPIIRQNQQLSLNVNVVNQSDQDFDMLPLHLIINNKEITSTVFDIKANSQQTAILNYIETTEGIKHAEIRTDDKGSFNYDDNFYFSYDLKNEISVLELYEKKNSSYLKSLFTVDSLFNFTSTNIKNIDYSSLGNYNFIILSDISEIADGTISELNKALSGGSVLLCIPSLDADYSKLNQFSNEIAGVQYSNIDTSRTQIEELALEHYLFKNVFEQIPNTMDLPVILKRFPILPQSGLIPLIKLMDGSLFIGLSNSDGKNIFFMSAALDDKSGNFHRHALIVPTFMNMAIYSKSSSDLYYKIGNLNEISIKTEKTLSDGAIQLINKKTKNEFIPAFSIRSNDIKIFPHIEDLEAGNYDIVNAGNILGGIAFNRNPEESQMNFFDEKTLNKFIKDENLENVKIVNQSTNLTKSFERILNKSSSIWSYFIVLALLFLIVEIAIIRFSK